MGMLLWAAGLPDDSGNASTASVRCVCAAAMLLLMAACAVDANALCKALAADFAASQVHASKSNTRGR